jgi:dTDP-glucose 4,6-dehydratase
MKNLLITGGAGFIGSNFVRFVLQTEKQVRIVNLDALTYAGSTENLEDLPDPERHNFVMGDICNRSLLDQLLQDYEIDWIVHFAAETHVDRSILGPDQFIRTNINGTFTLLEAARNYWAKNGKKETFRFHHISSDEVFGSLDLNEVPWIETSSYAPNSPYAASKAAGDHLVRAYGSTYGLPYLLTNCSNNYGPRQFPEKLIPLIILSALEGKPLPIYGDGKQIREWLYVADHCKAIWTVLQQSRIAESYNIGGNNQPTNLEIVNTLCSILDELLPGSAYTPHSQLISFVSDRPGHDRRYALNTNKITAQLGWRPIESLSSGLYKTVQWYLSHPDWIAAIKKQQDYQGWLAKNYQQRPIENMK